MKLFNRDNIKTLLDELKEIDWKETIKSINLSRKVKLITAGVFLAVISVITVTVINISDKDESTLTETAEEIKEDGFKHIDFNLSNGSNISDVTIDELISELKNEYGITAKKVTDTEVVFNNNKTSVFIEKKSKHMAVIVDTQEDLKEVKNFISKVSNEDIPLTADNGGVIEFRLN